MKGNVIENRNYEDYVFPKNYKFQKNFGVHRGTTQKHFLGGRRGGVRKFFSENTQNQVHKRKLMATRGGAGGSTANTSMCRCFHNSDSILIGNGHKIKHVGNNFSLSRLSDSQLFNLDPGKYLTYWLLFQSGYNELKDLLPPSSSFAGCKTTNAAILFRASDYVKTLEASIDKNADELGKLQNQYSALEIIFQQYENLSIGVQQQQQLSIQLQMVCNLCS